MTPLKTLILTINVSENFCMECQIKETNIDLNTATDSHGSNPMQQRMLLQLPEEKPLIRRSTSPTILLQGVDGCKLSAAKSTSVLIALEDATSTLSSHPDGDKKHFGSRKNSIVSFFFSNKTSELSPEESKQPNSDNFLNPTKANDILMKGKPRGGKPLLKSSSVAQLYNSVIQTLRTISKANEDILPELTKKFFEKVLRDSEKIDDLLVTKVKVRNGKEFGSHFSSEVHSLEVVTKRKGTEKEHLETFLLVVKSPPQSEDARSFLRPTRTFAKEVQMYSTVFSDMADFVRTESSIIYAKHPSDVLSIPKCYFSRSHGEGQAKDDLIIMENILEKGFSFIDMGDEYMNKIHVEMIVREIAKFHAISYCMKKGEDKHLHEKYTTLSKDSVYTKENHEHIKRTMTPIMANLAELIRSTPQYRDNYEWFIELAKNFHMIQTKMVESSDKFNVICHGDLWWSNILFKYPDGMQEEDCKVPIEVKFIDFQSARLASLVTDLVSFTFTSMSSSVRREHIEYFLEVCTI